MKIQNTNTDLAYIISLITARFDIEQIYLNRYEEGTASNELVILGSRKYIKSIGDIAPKIENLIKDYPDYKVICYAASKAKSRIREGNLFLFTSCQPNKLVYQKEGADYDPIPAGWTFERCKELAYAFWDRERAKIDEFKEGFYHFKENGKHPLAAFMAHQVLELTYRALELFLIGKEKMTHTIRVHHLSMQETSPFYRGVFDDFSEEDAHLLQKLDNIYRAARYEDNYLVDEEVLLAVEAKLKALVLHAPDIVDNAMVSFAGVHQANLEKPAEEIYSSSVARVVNGVDTLSLVVATLKERLPAAVEVYKFGYRVRSFVLEGIQDCIENKVSHFDLLIVSETDIREHVNNVQSAINQDSEITVLLLSYTRDQVQKELDKNSPFFHRTLLGEKALLYAGTEPFAWSCHEQMGDRTVEEEQRAKLEWYRRGNSANGFLNGAIAVDMSEQVGVKITMINLAIEQACLGMLAYHLGYKPYQQNLSHLYNLCCSFWYFPNDVFPRSTEEEVGLLRDLSNVVKEVRYKGDADIDFDEAYRYEDRCECFLEGCGMLVKGEQ